MVNIAMIKWI